MARLRRADPNSPGLTRRGSARPRYLHPDGAPVDAVDRERIKALAIPPAWRDVWICPQANGHIQAVGVDDRGRRQYIYHDRWREHRDREKFARVEALGKRLPKLREQTSSDLAATDELSRERVLAAAVRLLDLGVFRVGNDRYAEENGTYGLTTFERQHARIQQPCTVVFSYLAKGSTERTEQVRDELVCGVIRQLKRRRSRDGRLFAWRDQLNPRTWHNVTSDDVNAYIKEHTGIEAASAKDLRTWSASLLAAVELAEQPDPTSQTARTRAIRTAIRNVADSLGNTPAVCRASYVDPRVLDAYANGATIRRALTRAGSKSDPGERRAVVERALLRLLREH